MLADGALVSPVRLENNACGDCFRFGGFSASSLDANLLSQPAVHHHHHQHHNHRHNECHCRDHHHHHHHQHHQHHHHHPSHQLPQASASYPKLHNRHNPKALTLPFLLVIAFAAFKAWAICTLESEALSHAVPRKFRSLPRFRV